jgi:hypothetical protein
MEHVMVIEVADMKVASFTPEGWNEPQQVHLIIGVPLPGLKALVVRIHSRAALDEIVAALQSHGDEVFGHGR